MEQQKPKAVLFDLDGTLVESFTTKPLSGAAERIAQLRADGVKMAVCTNQAGPLWLAHTKDAKYPGAHRIKMNIVEIIRSLSLGGVKWFVSVGDRRIYQAMKDIYNDEKKCKEEYEKLTLMIVGLLRTQDFIVSASDEWRKPAPGMLLAAAKFLAVAPADCLYIGDMETDRQAAQAAGMQFEMVL